MAAKTNTAPKGYEKKELLQIMGQSYLDYSMSVITSRALPDVRDGLKPVQRRILYAMYELKNTPDKPHRKCARIVGDTMGKYHPHGDSSIYGALVYMAQGFNMGETLVDGHGNFGSMDGDGAAAMRYTEARLSKIALEMIRDMDSDTVDFVPNFDETEKEPVVLPSRIPNILVNGTQGIAVGMASSIPPHNLGEVSDACVAMLDRQIKGGDITSEELMDYVKGPDFPTGATILGNSYKDIYTTGKGKVEMEAVSHFETDKSGRVSIVFTELPYQTNKAALVKKIADYSKENRLDVIDVRDESSREGIRVVVELKKSAVPEMVLNTLKKHTPVRSSYSANMLCIVDREPKTLNLHDMIMYYLAHQEDVVTRRTKFELARAEKRAHIIDGLLIAIDNIDDVIATIKSSEDVESAKANLMAKYGFDDVQAQYIVDMRLRSLAGLETQKLKDELADLNKQIAECKKILGSRKELLKLIKKEMKQTADKYRTDRKTSFLAQYSDIRMEDIIEDSPVILMRTKMGYIKRISTDKFRAQKKGGKGSKGIAPVDGDYIVNLDSTTAHSDILFFTTAGKVYSLKAYEIPETGKNSRGTPLVSLLKLPTGEEITDVITAPKDLDKSQSIMMVTKKGLIKRMALDSLPQIKGNGLIVAKLGEGDCIRNTTLVHDTDSVLVISKNGYCVCYTTDKVKIQGRCTMGSHGIKLEDGDEVACVQKIDRDREVLLITSKGYVKKISCDDFRDFKTKNSKGVSLIKASKKEEVGDFVGTFLVEDSSEDLFVITDKGQTIRTPLKNIRTLSRTARGNRAIELPDDSVVTGITNLEKELEMTEDEEE